MRQIETILLSIAVVILSITASLHADNELSVTTKLLEEVGKNSTQLKSLNEAIPGTTVLYEHTITNSTATLATDLVFTDKVPNHTTFVEGSAKCQNCTILYSIDGEVFEKAIELFTYDSDSLRVVKSKEYRYVRWIIEELQPNSSQKISFKIKIN